MVVLGQQLLLVQQGLQPLLKFPLEDLGQIPDQFLEIGQLPPHAIEFLLAGLQLAPGAFQLLPCLLKGAAQLPLHIGAPEALILRWP
jgi:hypothetical protein